MGRSTTPAYRYEMVTTGGSQTPGAWYVGRRCGHGSPTNVNLTKYVKAFEESTKQGGVNAHLGTTVVFSAKIIRQSTQEVVATYRGPSFVVV